MQRNADRAPENVRWCRCVASGGSSVQRQNKSSLLTYILKKGIHKLKIKIDHILTKTKN